MQETLTTNAIIFISSGFMEPYVVQIIALHKIPGLRKLNLCLSDGDAYLGAEFEYEEMPKISKYSVVKVVAQLYSMQKPMLIHHLQVIDNRVDHMIRRSSSPQTLNQYLKRQGARITQLEQEMQSMRSLKKVKTSFIEFDIHESKSLSSQQENLPCQKKSLAQNYDAIGGRLNSYQQQSGAVSEQTESQGLPNESDAFQKIDGQNLKPNLPVYVQVIPSHNSIKDLYEKMIDWKILARVNFLQHFKCQTGKSALSFILQDQFGYEIKCTYFPKGNFLDKQDYPVQQGKIYTFSGGDIKIKRKNQRNQRNSEDQQQFKIKELEITFAQSLLPIKRESMHFPFQTKKLLRLCELKQKQHNSEVKIVGMLKRFNRRQNSEIDKKCKYQCILCDPVTKHEIEFGLAINERERKIQQGAIYVLHNFSLVKKQTEIRLYCSNRSYFTKQNENEQQIFENFKPFLKNTEWKTDEYKCLSAPPFKVRTIHRMKQLTQSNRQPVFSMIGCRIKEIKKERIYNACEHCQSSVLQKQVNLFYCSRCKKMVDYNRFFMFSVVFKDDSDNFKCLIAARNAQKLVGIETKQLQEMKDSQQFQHIQLLKLNKYVLCLKTEIKNDEIAYYVMRVLEGSVIQVLNRKQFEQMNVYELQAKIEQSYPN